MAEASLYVKGFIILRSEGGLTSFNMNNRVNFSGEQKQNETLSCFVVVFWVFFGEYGGNTQKFSSKLSLFALILIKRRRWFKLSS